MEEWPQALLSLFYRWKLSGQRVSVGLPGPSINSLILSRVNPRPAQTRRPGGASHLERTRTQGAAGLGVLVQLGLGVGKGTGAALGG